MTRPGQPDALQVHPQGDVLVALRDLQPGQALRWQGRVIVARSRIAPGHKVAAGTIEAGAAIRKYGSPLGRATCRIQAGEHVHTHNLATALTALTQCTYTPAAAAPPAPDTRTFLGYRRSDGRVGTRNELWVLCSVGCVARTARRIATEIPELFGAEHLLMARAVDEAVFEQAARPAGDFKRYFTAAGATVLLFTTGRGTPLGFPAPTLKISTTSALAQAKPRWIDFDAGRLLEGAKMDELAHELFALVIETASGRASCAERNGEREVAIWKTGVTL